MTVKVDKYEVVKVLHIEFKLDKGAILTIQNVSGELNLIEMPVADIQGPSLNSNYKRIDDKLVPFK